MKYGYERVTSVVLNQKSAILIISVVISMASLWTSTPSIECFFFFS
ncbi:unnamed protein product [Gongylonema pulchrum]|uniref:Uncharacterized protein n=1 Tax=Gongylonema pulchrum TaxID=637853 RepID=A0A3P7N3E3_9BILA|nr:unnamed protein product [Gongylonema pulchrum]